MRGVEARVLAQLEHLVYNSSWRFSRLKYMRIAQHKPSRSLKAPSGDQKAVRENFLFSSFLTTSHIKKNFR